jgi:hypothetical protein
MEPDLFPHSLTSVDGLNLQAAIENADLHAAKHEAAHGQEVRRLDPRARGNLRSHENELTHLHSKLRTLTSGKVFDPSPARDALATDLRDRIAKLRRTINTLRGRAGGAAAAAMIAGLLTLAAWFPAEPPSIDRSLLQRAPHEAEPARTQPDVRDDVGRAFSRWI